jgi:hypothetical protein
MATTSLAFIAGAKPTAASTQLTLAAANTAPRTRATTKRRRELLGEPIGGDGRHTGPATTAFGTFFIGLGRRRLAWYLYKHTHVRSVEPFLLYQHHTCALQGHGSARVWRAVLISGRTPLVGAVPGDGFNFDVTEGALQIRLDRFSSLHAC